MLRSLGWSIVFKFWPAGLAVMLVSAVLFLFGFDRFAVTRVERGTTMSWHWIRSLDLALQEATRSQKLVLVFNTTPNCPPSDRLGRILRRQELHLSKTYVLCCTDQYASAPYPVLALLTPSRLNVPGYIELARHEGPITARELHGWLRENSLRRPTKARVRQESTLTYPGG